MNNVLPPHKQMTDAWAMLLSLTIHGLIFLMAYYLPTQPPASGRSAQPYKVGIDLQSFHTSPPALSTIAVGQITPAPAIQRTSKKTTPSPKQVEQEPTSQPVENQANVSTEEPAIDTRGLYTDSGNDKKAGAALEMTGWMWDAVPYPLDNTNEIGKLVFEIVIDDTGEIIGIKTVEKTVSPLVEQLYKDEVAKLTFSKTSKEQRYTATSTGKITFILQYK